jgi:outer membrane autotransporter protein
MKKNNSNLKKLLATSALTALLIAGSGNALGETTDGDANLTTGVGLDTAAAFVDGNELILDGAHDVDTGALANALTIANINLQGNTGQTFTVSAPIAHTVTINAIAGAAAEVMNFTVDASELIFAGVNNDSHKGIGEITLTDAASVVNLNFTNNADLNNVITFNDADATVAIKNTSFAAGLAKSVEVNLNAAISGNAPNSGILILNPVDDNLTIQGVGALGAQGSALQELKIECAAGNPNARTVTVSVPTYAATTLLMNNVHFTVNTDHFSSPITTATDEQGQLTLSKANIQGIGDIGTEGLSLGGVEIDEDNSLKDVYSGSIKVAAGKTVTLGSIFGATTTLGDAGTSITFLDGAQVNSPVTGVGSLSFAGGSMINKDLGAQGKNLAKVEFLDNAGKAQAIAANIYADDITFNATQVDITNNITFDGPVTAENTTFNLTSNNLTITDVNTFKGDITISTDFNNDTNTIGKITLDGAAAEIDPLAVNSLAFKIKYSGANPPAGEPVTTPALFLAQNGADLPDLSLLPPDFLDKITVAPSGFITWRFNEAEWTFTGFYDPQGAATDILDSLNASQGTKDAAMKLLNPENTLDAEEYAGELRDIAGADPKAFAQSVERFRTAANNTPVLSGVISRNQNVIAARAITTTPGSIIGNQNIAAVAAGDAQKYARYGVWANPFYERGTQKHSGNVDGYKSRSSGITAGFDTMANDTMTVGIAASYAKTDIKHKDTLAGDTTKINTYLLSIYGTQLVCDDYFVTGIATFGSSKVKDNSTRIGFANGAITQEKAKSSYDAMNWGGELLTGYHYKIQENATLIPTIGLAYNEFSQAGHTEKGTRNQNRSISKKNSRKIEAIAGLKAITGIESGGVIYTPEAHAYVRHALSNKNPKTEIKLNGLVDPITAKAVKESKTTVTLGTSLTVQSGIMDYALGYDISLAKKYVGHEGSLKVRVNF